MTMMEGHMPNDVGNERAKWPKNLRFRIEEERTRPKKTVLKSP